MVAKMKPSIQITPRQRQVLRMIVNGFLNREIGERLGISVRTVEVHRFNLMRRLKVQNVAQLLQTAYKRGVIKPPLLRKAS